MSGVEVDRDTSTVTIDGHRFPACSLVCPPMADDDPADRWDRSLGVPSIHPDFAGQVDVYVPMENGALAHISSEAEHYELSINARWCFATTVTPNNPSLWLPAGLSFDGEWLRPASRIHGPSIWWGCEAWWVAETIQRIAGAGFDTLRPAGAPLVECVPYDSITKAPA